MTKLHQNNNNLTCSYNEEIGGIIANIIGEIDSDDIDKFEQNLLNEIDLYCPGAYFKLLLNGNGYYPESMAVHIKYRTFLKSTDCLIL